MRLSKVRLAGFKSFVDPVTLSFPGDLIGVVGPNGCGKSNIIDAIMWVMGESSAKNLRGESMTDVIFSGAASRKPVGQATVELIFDNSDGRVGGQYAEYSEIAIKRQIGRDGLSVYYLNNTRCRRRDITDIFLGTGFGPRSYSIIGQGMISRIIESKPEELRAFIEEAAGISRYKERRRETENRIRRTRDNLSRINDIIDELSKQLDKLNRQAKAAERYQGLKDEARTANARLLAALWRDLNLEMEIKTGEISERENAVETALGGQRAIEAGIEVQREARTESGEVFNTAQSRYYGVGADISRLEQGIAHARDQRQRLDDARTEAVHDCQAVQDSLSSDQQELDALNEALGLVEPDLSEAQLLEDSARDGLAAAEQEVQAWQKVWDDFNARGSSLLQAAEVQRTRIENLEQQLGRRSLRIDRLAGEDQAHDPARLEAELAAVRSETETAETARQTAQATVETLHVRVREQREQNQADSAELDDARSETQTLSGRLASLDALQQAALGQQQEGVSRWLGERRLDQAPRIAQKVTVESGWEAALETVLGFHLESVCVEGLDAALDALDDLEEGTLSLFDTSIQPVAQSRPSLQQPLLGDKVSAPWSLDGLMAGIFCAEDINAAMALRPQLGVNESVVTRSGVWIGREWLRVVRSSSDDDGILPREREIKQVRTALDGCANSVDELATRLDQGRERLVELEDELQDAQRDLNLAQSGFAELQSRYAAQQARAEELRARAQQVSVELSELQQEQSDDHSGLATSRETLEQAITQLEGHETERETLANERRTYLKALEKLRTQWHAARDHSQNIAIQQASRLSQRDSLVQALQRLQERLDKLLARREEIDRELGEREAPLTAMQGELEQMLEQRIGVERELADARRGVESVDHELRNLEQKRSESEQQIQGLRDRLEEVRMDSQATLVRRQTVEEQLVDSQRDLKALLEDLGAEVTVRMIEDQVADLSRKITRLGPINLAAIDEFTQLSERKEYLDSQHDDLHEALEILEQAISKIDRETRTRFKETFERVNDGLQDLFPQLFGGGHAYLELTGDDLLTAGIAVMAQPPGKRNSNIRLLSGGEKALTAIAMVFSLFRLNPSPVCLLDEVDAPLDDANIGRFSNMVKKMSSTVQFIFITHNKATMEIAEQLVGVTMHEPGVSRLVTVDIESAVELVTE